MTAGLHLADALVLVIYLLGITALGVWMARRVHDIADYFMPRRFGKAVMIMHAFGTGTASDQAVGVASATFRWGLSGIWFQWLWLFSTPFYWLIAPIMRRFRAVTTADVLTLRYDRGVAVLFALVGIANMSVKIGVVLLGSGALIDSCTGELVDRNLAIAIMSVLFVLYGAAGGLAAAIVTDFVQGILTIVFSLMLLPFVFGAVGGMPGVHRAIADEAMLSLVAPGHIGPFFITMMALQVLAGIVAQPHVMGVCAAGKTEMEGRVGFMVGNLVKRLCTIAWCLTAIAAVAWYLQRGVDLSRVKPDNVYGDVARAFLRPMPGLLGVFLASLLAGVMSSCDSFMISSSGLFTENIYRPMVPGRSGRHYVWVGRVTGLAVVAGGLAFAYSMPDVVEGLKAWFKIAVPPGIAFWLGLLWRRTTVAGAWAATLLGYGSWWLATRQFFIDLVQDLPSAEPLRFTVPGPDKLPVIYEPWTILFYTTMATLAGVLVSLATRPVDREKLDRFYGLTRTPITPGEQIGEPCTLPSGIEPPRRRMLLTALGLEIPMPSRTSLIGFLVGWLAVAGLIGGFCWFVRP